MKKFENVLQLKVSLKNARPSIYRTIYFPADATFLNLHAVIQEAMGWQSSHLYGFNKGFNINIGIPVSDGSFFSDDEMLDVATQKIADFLSEPKNSINYEYDFGDGWEHSVVVEKVFAEILLPHLPYCLRGKNACPFEDCGGIWGYYEILEVFADKKDPRYKEYNKWYNFKKFDPSLFDLKEVNSELENFEELKEFHHSMYEEIKGSL